MEPSRKRFHYRHTFSSFLISAAAAPAPFSINITPAGSPIYSQVSCNLIAGWWPSITRSSTAIMQRPVKIRSARHKLTRTGVRYMYVAHLALDIVHTYSLSLSLSFLLFPQFPPSACLNCIDRRVPPDSSFSFFFFSFFFGWRERERRKNGCLNVRKDLPFSLSLSPVSKFKIW